MAILRVTVNAFRATNTEAMHTRRTFFPRTAQPLPASGRQTVTRRPPSGESSSLTLP